MGGAKPPAPCFLDKTQFEAKGLNETLLSVKKFGRCAITAKSAQGTSIQLVDKMLGPLENDGVPGGRDGRLDCILDAGSYQIVARSSDQGAGALVLSAKSFSEINERAPVLQETVPTALQLSDLQQASYWLEVPERRTVYIEAMGRNLSDMRLWYQGNWLLPDLPDEAETSPVPGRPQTRLLMVATLDKGSYLVTAYGGVAKPWAKQSEDHPFCLRLGIPSLEANARRDASVSPFGADRYIVPRASSAYVLQLGEKRDFRLEAKAFRSGDPLEPFDQSASISKKSQDPECRILFQTYKEASLVTVVGQPGEKYTLEVFEPRDEFTLKEPGRFLIETLHSGFPDDAIDATGILVSDEERAPHVVSAAADVIHLGTGKGWARRFNLLDEETVFFFVEEPGTYELKSEGTPVSARFEPFMLTAPPNHSPPPYKPGSSTWVLDPGYWVLSLSPDKKGIATLAVRKKGGLWQSITGALLGEGAISGGSAKGACLLPDVLVNPGHSYTLYLNEQKGVERGILARRLPLDLSSPLPVTLMPGQMVKLPFHAATSGRLSFESNVNGDWGLSVEGTKCGQRCDVGPGDHEVSVTNKGAHTAVFLLSFAAADRLPGAAPAYLPTSVTSAFDQFDILTDKSPLFFDLDRGESKTVLLEVAAPALYRIETTGLLATSCTIRTRTRTSLFEDAGSGAGRNSLIQTYLKPGEYQVTVQARGRSKGHLGIEASQMNLLEGGPLRIGGETREKIPAGAAVAHPFTILERGTYLLSTVGVDKTFNCRIEDPDGWPLLRPGLPARVTREFSPGTYGYVSLPCDVETLRDTRLERVETAPKIEGHGPHPIVLNGRVENVWHEPAKGEPRERDVYDFTVPAEVTATIGLGEAQMQAYLRERNGSGGLETIAEVPAGKGWSGKLSPGDYRIEAECSRQNDLLPYAVSVSVRELVPGLSKGVSVPADLLVSLSKAGLVDLSSAGNLDVRASLYRDSDGALVAEDDDDYDNWNFRIDKRLQPGRYTLRVEPVGGGSGNVTVAMATPEEVTRKSMEIPAERKIDLEGKINVFPLPPVPVGAVLAVSASGDSSIGLAVEKAGADGLRTLAARSGRSCEALVALAGGAGYQIRLWSRDHQSESAMLRIGLAKASVAAESSSGESLRISPSLVAGMEVAVAAFRAGSPGTFEVEPSSGLLFGQGQDSELATPPLPFVALRGGENFLALKTRGSEEARVRLIRRRLEPGPEGALPVGVAGGAGQWIDVSGAGDEITLLTATSDGGVPVCDFAPKGGVADGPVQSGVFDFFSNGCVSAVVGDPRPRARIWRATAGAAALPPVRVGCRRFRLPQSMPPLAFGLDSASVEPGGCVGFSLPPGPKRLVVDISKGGILLLGDSAVNRIAAAVEEALHASMDTTDATLYLVNPTAQRVDCSLSCQAGAEVPELEVREGKPFERLFSEAGTERVRVVPPQGGGWRLFASAPGASLVVMGPNGVVRSGSPVSVSGEGYAWLTHEAGLSKIWMAKDEGVEARWGAPVPEGRAVPANSVSPVSGRSAGFLLHLAEGGVLHAQMSCGGTIALKEAGLQGRFVAATENAAETGFDHYLEAGSYLLMARGPAGSDLTGTIGVFFEPVKRIAGTFGPQELIGPGESKSFVFEVKTGGFVGIGLRTEGERLSCDLMTQEGRLIGRGIQQFVKLDPGLYLLKVRADGDAAPIRVSPVVVGLQPPSSGPPEEALREFFTSVGVMERGE